MPVKSFDPNAWGLYDMHGNVWEWCSDWYGEYGGEAETNPTGASRGGNRVLRGGCYYSSAICCRSTNRGRNSPFYRNKGFGFRLVLQVKNSLPDLSSESVKIEPKETKPTIIKPSIIKSTKIQTDQKIPKAVIEEEIPKAVIEEEIPKAVIENLPQMSEQKIF